MAHGEDPVRAPRSLLAARPRLDRRAVEPRAVVVVLPRGRRRPLSRSSTTRGGTEVSGGIVGGNVIGPIKPASFSGPCIGTAADVVDDAGAPVRGEVGELVIRAPHAGHDPRLLARPGALRRDVLVALARDRGPTATGRGRCRRLLVHPRPLRRHAQGRRQARRPGRGRERRGGPPGRRSRRPPSASRTRSRARRSSCCASCAGRGRRRRPPRGRSRAVSPRISASRSSRRSWRSCEPSRRPAPARSCGASIRAAWLGLDPGDLSALDDPASVEAIRAVSLGR